jgi:hypothetical protein
MSTPDQIRSQIVSLEQQLLDLEETELPMTPSQQQLAAIISHYLDTHVTLDNAVPASVGCAEAVSFILLKVGITIPFGGIASTLSLLQFMEKSDQFIELTEPEAYAVLVSATGTGNGTVEGHTGFFGVFGQTYVNDWPIVSNDSNTGLLRELWSWVKWTAHYTQSGGLPPRIFRVSL